MSVWEDKLRTPRYRVDPIIDDGDHFMLELVSGWDLACYNTMPARDTKHTGTRFGYCPFCGDEL